MNERMTFPSPAVSTCDLTCRRFLAVSLSSLALRVDQAFSRTLSAPVDGSSLHPQCPPQIWTLVRRQWGQEQKLPAPVKTVVAPATPWPLPSNVPSYTHSLLRLLSSPRILPSAPAFLTRPCFRRPTAQSLYDFVRAVFRSVSPQSFVGPAFIEGYHMQ